MKSAPIIAAAVSMLAVAVPTRPSRSAPSIDSQVTFLYYKDVAAAAQFYGGILGLEQTFDEGWVEIYRISSTSYVGLVDETRGSHRASESKPVMLSIVTDEVDAWYEHIRGADVTILSEISDGTAVPVRSFMVEDPGGYTIEFFRWR